MNPIITRGSFAGCPRDLILNPMNMRGSFVGCPRYRFFNPMNMRGSLAGCFRDRFLIPWIREGPSPVALDTFPQECWSLNIATYIYNVVWDKPLLLLACFRTKLLQTRLKIRSQNQPPPRLLFSLCAELLGLTVPCFFFLIFLDFFFSFIFMALSHFFVPIFEPHLNPFL